MKRPNKKNTNPAYWNSILAEMGLGVKLRRLPKKKLSTGKKIVRTNHAPMTRRMATARNGNR